MTFCAQKTTKIKFLGRGVLRDEFLPMWELSGWQSEHFLILSYGPKLHSWPFVLKKRRKSNFWGEEFFGMSSYQCENFQLFILYNFQFHHMVLKWLPDTLNSIFDFFEKSDFFFDFWFWLLLFWLLFFLNLLKSRSL